MLLPITVQFISEQQWYCCPRHQILGGRNISIFINDIILIFKIKADPLANDGSTSKTNSEFVPLNLPHT